METTVHREVVFADYFQFVLMDANSEADFSTIWADEAFASMLAAGPGAICPGTFRNVDVPVEIHVCTLAPEIDIDQYDHVAEASIDVASGELLLTNCTGYLPDARRISVAPGMYEVLFLASGIESIKNEWDPADDNYSVYLWPGKARTVNTVKHWQRADA
jgi:hypothetical protein